MADPLRKVPESDFTVEPFVEPALPEHAVAGAELDRGEGDRRLVNAAEGVGSTLGSAVGRIRKKVRSGLKLVKERSAEGGTTVDDLTSRVQDRTSQFRDDARLRLRRWNDMARRQVRIARVRTKEFSQERPAEFVLAIGGVAVVVGVILRLWRSNRD